MSLRVKLALLLSLAIAIATLAAASVFLLLEYSSLNSVEANTRQVMVESVSDLIDEALLAKDPLMLIDYLRGLMRGQTIIKRCRVWLGDHWQDVQGSQKDFPKSDALVLDAKPVHGKAEEMRAQIWLSRPVIEEQHNKARGAVFSEMAWTGVVVTLIGLLISLPLSWTFSRRLLRIESAVGKIGEGGKGVRLPSLGGDEIGRLAQGLNQMSERLEELDRLKKDFVASVTHELRSPLGAIESYVGELVKSGNLNDQDRQSLTRILKNATRLSHFVSNLLQMAKIEHGKLDFSPRPSDFAQVVEDCALFFEPSAKELRIALKCTVDSDIGTLRLDPDLISHVLTNFISNSLKFTRPGGAISITLKRFDGMAECSVADTGVGIEKKDLARLFSPFERIRNPLKATGVGLGLAISKSIIEMHKGSIGAASEIGKGSRFYFRIPLA